MQAAIYGLSGPELTADERAFFRDCDPAGHILFHRNCSDREQLRRLTADLRAIPNLLNREAELLDHLVIEGIQLVGAIQSQRRDAVSDGERDRVEGHTLVGYG